MTVRLTRDTVDLAIVTNDLARMARFYIGVLGFTDGGTAPTRSTRGGRVHRLRCGTTGVKLVRYDPPVPAQLTGGDVHAATGFRYCTLHVANLDDIVGACERAGAIVVTPVKEVSPGVRIAIVEDPDGNWIEFLGDDRAIEQSERDEVPS